MTPAFSWEVAAPDYLEETPFKSWKMAGVITENFPRILATQASVTLTSGTLYLAGGLVLPAGRKVSSVSFFASAALVTGVNQWFALYDYATRALLAITIDDLANAWAAVAFKTLPLVVPYTPPTNQMVYAGVMVNATTPPVLSSGGTSRTTFNQVAPIICGNSNAGLTTPATAPNPAAAIAAAAIQTPWVGVN